MYSKNYKGGLRKLPRDDRDFSLSLLGAISESTIPAVDFMVSDKVFIHDQGNSDCCTGFSLTAVSEDQEEIELSPEYTFAKIKQIQGNWQSWGGDLRAGCKAAVKFGFLEKSPYTLDLRKGRAFIANWANWPLSSDLNAKQHAKISYFAVDGPNDRFGNILSALWLNKDKKQSVYTGATWRGAWNTHTGIIPKKYGSGGVGHAFKVCGQKIINGERYLVIQNSFGDDYGDKGFNYFPREVVNKEFVYGCYQFADKPAEEIKQIMAIVPLPKTIEKPKLLKDKILTFIYKIYDWFKY